MLSACAMQLLHMKCSNEDDVLISFIKVNVTAYLGGRRRPVVRLHVITPPGLTPEVLMPPMVRHTPTPAED